MLSTAWGIGGAIGAAVVGYSMTNGEGYTLAYTVSAAMMAVCIVLAFITRPLSEAKIAELKNA